MKQRRVGEKEERRHKDGTGRRREGRERREETLLRSGATNS